MPSNYETLRHQEGQILNQIKATLSFAPTMIGEGNVLYASSPITTGRRMYDRFQEHGATSVDELNRTVPGSSRDIMQKNIEDGRQFGNELRTQTGKLAIVPGEFFGPGWAQEHYMSLWKQVINRYADEVHLNTNWEYSNGCAEEFLIGLEKDMPLVERHATNGMTQKEGVAKIHGAIDHIGAIGAEPKKLFDVVREIELFKPRTIIDLKSASV